MSVRRWHRVAATVVAVGAVLALTAAPAQAATVNGTAKAPNGLTIRNGPGSGFNAVGTMAYNSTLPVMCYAIGESVSGDAYWDVVYAGPGQPTYVSDYWLDTGGDVVARGVPSCRTTLSNETASIARKQGGLPVYANPGDSQPIASLAYGEWKLVLCYKTGPSVSGSNRWDEVLLDYGMGYSHTGFVSDYWLYTGGDVSLQTGYC